MGFPGHYEPSPECFRFTAGVLEGLPRLLALDPAEVQWSATSHTATYIVKPPRSQTLWSRFRRLFRTVFASHRTLEELIDQQRALNLKHQELKSAYAQVSEALQARQRFLRVVSHELRTPLNGILGASSLLRFEEDPDAAAQLFDALQHSTGRLSKLVDEMLDFVVMNEAEVKIAPRNLDLRCDISVFLRAHGEAARRKNLTIDFKVADDFPDEVRVDGQRLLRAVGQLLDNAIKFTHAGSVTVKLSFDRGEAASGDVCIAVADTGPGIREDDKLKIFSAFEQGDDSSTRSTGGTGLGLALAHRSIKLLNGKIDVESTLNVGTCFSIRVPVEAVHKQAVPIPSATSSSRTKILVVDDDRINRMLLRRMIVKEGFSVDLAEDGVQAVAMVQQNHYDLVFMDCEMPNMDGWQATRKIRENGPLPRIVAATAYATPADRERCRDAGMDGFLAKPVSMELVNSVLQRWVTPTPEAPADPPPATAHLDPHRSAATRPAVTSTSFLRQID